MSRRGQERPASTLLADLVAGVSVSLILVPQALAYAELAGMPPVRGLYAAALPSVIAAVFASSPWLQTGPVALTALLTFGALSSRAVPGSDAYIGQAALLAMVVGVTRLSIGSLRAGAVTYLMSHAVLRGFTLGAALLISASQIPSILGVAPELTGIFARAGDALIKPDLWDWEAIGFSGLTVSLIAGGRLVHPLFPGLLVAVVAAIGISVAVGYGGFQVGEIPAGLPEFSLALPWAELPYLIFPGIVIALVGFAEAASISQTFAEREQRPWDPNREFVSQGAANLASSVSGAFPVGGSFSRSAINHLAGARTRASGGITGLAVLAILPFTGMLGALPKAVLGMAILSAIRGLLNPAPLLEMWRLSRPQAGVGLATFVLTLVFAPRVEIAVVSGVALAIAVHLWREGEQEFGFEKSGHELTVRPMGVLWFGSAPAFRRTISRRLGQSPEARSLVVDLSGVGRLDLSGAYALKASLDAAVERGVSVALANVPPQLTRIVGKVCPKVRITTAAAESHVRQPKNAEEHQMPIEPSELVARAKAQVRTIGAGDAANQIRRRGNVLLIDVREPNEHEKGVVEGAELVPRGLLESKIGGLCSSPEQDILLYCAAGNRAALATKTLVEMGYTNATCIDCSFAELAAAVESWRPSG
ncbi:MAG: STAS domain-containing protein [Myxococcales bacterium]|nr:STAS domain-containing protein [Myxococcales bacterium]